MKYYELINEEEKLLKEVEAGEWVSVKNSKAELKDAIATARNTLNKTKNINIRLSEKVLLGLKAKAAKEGIPYQTLASSVLHRFVSR